MRESLQCFLLTLYTTQLNMCDRKSSKMAFYAKRAIIKLITKQKLYTLYFGVSFKLFQSIGLLIIFSYELIKQPTFFQKLKRVTIFLRRATCGPRVIGWRPLLYSIHYILYSIVILYTPYSIQCIIYTIGVQHNCITGPKFSSPFLKGPHNSALNN